MLVPNQLAERIEGHPERNWGRNAVHYVRMLTVMLVRCTEPRDERRVLGFHKHGACA
jgi:hypothetical protein